MPTTTYRSVLRSHMGASRRTTPAAVDGFIHLKVDCGLTTKQIVGLLPKNARIAGVYRVGTPAGFTEAAAGTFQLDLEAVTTPALSLVNAVAAGATAALGSKTVVAASLLLCFNADRNISVTWTGGTAGQTAWIAVQVIPHDDGREQT